MTNIINKLEEQNQNLTKQVISLKSKTQITNNNSLKIRRVCKIENTPQNISFYTALHIIIKNSLNDNEKTKQGH